MRISKGERHDLGAAAPFSTTTSSLQGRAGGSVFTPKLVEVVFGPASTRRAEKSSPCITCTAVAAPSVRSRVFVVRVRLPPWRDVAAERPALGLCCSKSIVVSSIFLSHTSSIFQYASTNVGWPDPNSFCWETRSLPSGTASLSFRGMLGKSQYEGIFIALVY